MYGHERIFRPLRPLFPGAFMIIYILYNNNMQSYVERGCLWYKRYLMVIIMSTRYLTYPPIMGTGHYLTIYTIIQQESRTVNLL